MTREQGTYFTIIKEFSAEGKPAGMGTVLKPMERMSRFQYPLGRRLICVGSFRAFLSCQKQMLKIVHLRETRTSSDIIPAASRAGICSS
ncbi:MAG: hypothetical protein WC674_03110, partial [Candidatus Krumholzibacteriia bacterium]